MVLEFLLIAVLSGGSSITVKNFNDAVACDDAAAELIQFQKLHEKDADRAMWTLLEDAKKDEDDLYQPKPYPSERFPDPALQVERLISKQLGIEMEEETDPWADIPMLAHFDASVRYLCIASVK